MSMVVDRQWKTKLQHLKEFNQSSWHLDEIFPCL